MDQTSRMIKSNMSPSSCVDDMDKMMVQMMNLFEIWLKQPYFCDDQIPRRFGNGHKWNAIFDVIKNKDAQLLLSSLLTNFVRLLGPQAMQEAKNGVWRDRLDDKYKNKAWFWEVDEYNNACRTLYAGINQYIKQMVSQYKKQHANADERWVQNPPKVDMDIDSFQETWEMQMRMAEKCKNLYLISNRTNYKMDYLGMILKFMILSMFLVMSKSINFGFGEEKQQKSIHYEPNIKDVIFSKQPTSSFEYTPRTTIWQNLADVVNFAPFNLHNEFSNKNNMLALEYNNQNDYDYQPQWISDQSFRGTPSTICPAYKPLNTKEESVPAFKTLLDFSPSANNAVLTNLTANNHFYDLFMDKQCIDLVQHVIDNDVDNALFVANNFHSSWNPKDIPLSKGGRRLLFEENAGGNSEISEAFSFEVLRHCFGSRLLKTEMEIKYQYKHCKITDYLAEINGKKIGVSVTRAFKYKGEFTKRDAIKLLTKKIHGVNESTINVCEQDEFSRQILHIWTTQKNVKQPREIDILKEVFQDLILSRPTFIGNTIILVTVASEDVWWIFEQKRKSDPTKEKEKKRKKRKRKRQRKRKREKANQHKN